TFPYEITEELAYLCGLIASDGTFKERGFRQITFVNTETALHDRVRDILSVEYGYTPKRYLNPKYFDHVLPQGTHPKSLQDCYTLFINPRVLWYALRPWNGRVLELHPVLIAAWLRVVFDGDGYVRLNETAPQAVISAWKPETNHVVRAALLRIG